MSKTDVNPLNEEQRETSGADTWRKYRYQYDWALYEMISNHDQAKEYVIFLEYHEDVIFADSIDLKDVNFTFNQVKTIGTSYTVNSICKRDGDKMSVLGKLIDSCTKKRYSSRISSMSIVSTGGFSFKDDKGRGFDGKTKLSKIKKQQLKKIEKNMISELLIGSLPLNIYFEVPVLPQKKFQDMVIGGVSRLVSKIHPRAVFDPGEIYRLLIDELGLKGEITKQYPSWSEAVSRKGLTSITVEKVIGDYTERKGEDQIHSELLAICNDLGFNPIIRRSMIKAFKRHRNLLIGNRSPETIRMNKDCHDIIEQGIRDNLELKNILDHGKNNLMRDYPNHFISSLDAEAALLNQFIDES